MENTSPLERSKEEFQDIIDRIKSDSAVGIDAQFTHAVIIEYLIRAEERLKRLEGRFISK